MLIVECTYRCKPGTRDQLLAIVKPNVEGSRKEKGNISYTQYPSPENDVDMFVFEKWENPEVFRQSFLCASPSGFQRGPKTSS
ncbi:hypothetical protein ER57_13330 [Smithella sp. SCADC]|jgi:quinol monooxygenase YgiN|nr:hypothetical protein ER57_13330 [Smithella sp. SCADC]HAR50036.1 hypothetical protein [Smithella sp.]